MTYLRLGVINGLAFDGANFESINCVEGDMTVKQIWGTIFIVLGVILVISGFTVVGDVEFLYQLMQDTYKMTGHVNSGLLKDLVEQSQDMYIICR